MNAARVAVTGIGVVSAAGAGVEKSFAALSRGRGLAARVPRLVDAGVTPGIAAVNGDISFATVMRPADERRYDRTTKLGLVAAAEAISAAGLHASDLANASICVGTGSAGLASFEEMVSKWESTHHLSPYSAPKAMVNSLAAAIAISHGVHGPADTFATACAGGATAIGEAARRIRHGYAGTVIAGGADAPVSPFNMSTFAKMGALATPRPNVDESSRPFSDDRDGFVMGEGAAFLILEPWEGAHSRGASILGEVLGYAATSDAFHIVAPHPDGVQARACIEAALSDASITGGSVDHVNAHGTATQLNDEFEARIIEDAFGSSTPVIAHKGVTGHMLGASAAFEFAMDLICTRRGVLPPIANLGSRDSVFQLDLVSTERTTRPDAAFVSNSFGFGGHNAVLVGRGTA